MTIEVFGKKGCAICDAAKGKLKMLNLPFTVHELEDRLAPHEGWRTDGTVVVLAKYAATNQSMPILLIDGDAYDYPGAMRKLKEGRDTHGDTPS